MLLAVLTSFTGLAFGQTQNVSIPVDGGGTLAYQYEVQSGTCGSSTQTSADTWENFTYTSSGGTATSLNGSIDYVFPCSAFQINGGWDYVNNNYSSDDWSNELTLTPTVSINGQNCSVAFDASEYDAQGSASISCTQSEVGYVDPKYVIMGVTYAPPGPASYVQYTNSNLIGTTSTINNSFKTGLTQSVSFNFGVKIPLVSKGKITTTSTTAITQTSSTADTVSASMQSTSTLKTYGTSDYFAPVNNDYDIIWVWLNPAVILTVSQNSVVWNGYGYDGTDEPGLDIIGIPVGYLNGDFGSMPPDLSTALARTWANGQMWPSGQGPGLTSTDLAKILAADPFSSSDFGPNDITYDPPTETPDHRFTLARCDTYNETFQYSQGDPSSPSVISCTLTYTNMSRQAQSQSSMTSQMFSVDVSFQGTAFLASLNGDLKTSYSLSWTTGSQSSITSSTTSSASLSVQGPPCNNSTPGIGPCIPVYDAGGGQPISFAVYQDNVYGTFMFAPIHYYQ